MSFPVLPLVGFLRGLITEGIGPTAGLRAFREAGGSVRTQRWYASYGEILNESAVRPRVLEAPTSGRPSVDQITRIESTKPGAYNYRGGVVVSTRSVDPITGRDVETTEVQYATLRSRRLMDYQTAQAELESRFGPEGESGMARQTVLGSFVLDVNELVAPTV